MSVLFPRPMPVYFAKTVKFEPEVMDFQSPEANGRVLGVTAGQTLWSGIWTLGTISRTKSDEVRAWKASLRGSQRLFYGYEVGRERPLAHQDGTPFGQPTGW